MRRVAGRTHVRRRPRDLRDREQDVAAGRRDPPPHPGSVDGPALRLPMGDGKRRGCHVRRSECGRHGGDRHGRRGASWLAAQGLPARSGATGVGGHRRTLAGSGRGRIVMVGAASTGPSPLWFATRGAGSHDPRVPDRGRDPRDLDLPPGAGPAHAALRDGGAASELRPLHPCPPRRPHRRLGARSVCGHPTGDAVIPFAGAYRTVWLGLGVIAAEVLVAVTATSLLRERSDRGSGSSSTGPRTRHGRLRSPTGSGPAPTPRRPGCSASARPVSPRCFSRWRGGCSWDGSGPRRSGSECRRRGRQRTRICAWAVGGPLQPGWAVKAGTPTSILTSGSSTHPPGRIGTDSRIR